MSKPVCLVTGVGPEHGTGAEIARRFSEGGYRVAMLARNEENLDFLAGKYSNTSAFPCDVGELDSRRRLFARVAHREVVIVPKCGVPQPFPLVSTAHDLHPESLFALTGTDSFDGLSPLLEVTVSDFFAAL